MDSPRGHETTTSTHVVKTLSQAKEWYDGTVPSDLPVTIWQDKAGTRIRITVLNNKKEIIHRRG